MVARELDATAAGERRSLDDVDAGTVVPLHVTVASHESRRLAAAQVARDGEGLEEDLGHHHRAAEIQHDPAVVERGERCGEPLEIAVARGAERRAIGRGMLVDDVGAERGVHRDRDAPVGRAQ